MKTAVPRVPSDHASQRTIRQRTAAIERFRAALSGGDIGGVTSCIQLRHELSRTSVEDRRSLLREAGFVVPENNIMPPGTGLALNDVEHCRRRGCLHSGNTIRPTGCVDHRDGPVNERRGSEGGEKETDKPKL